MRYIEPQTPGDKEWNLRMRLLAAGLSQGEAQHFIDNKELLKIATVPLTNLEKVRAELEACLSL